MDVLLPVYRHSLPRHFPDDSHHAPTSAPGRGLGTDHGDRDLRDHPRQVQNVRSARGGAPGLEARDELSMKVQELRLTGRPDSSPGLLREQWEAQSYEPPIPEGPRTPSPWYSLFGFTTTFQTYPVVSFLPNSDGSPQTRPGLGTGKVSAVGVLRPYTSGRSRRSVEGVVVNETCGVSRVSLVVPPIPGRTPTPRPSVSDPLGAYPRSDDDSFVPDLSQSQNVDHPTERQVTLPHPVPVPG